MIAELDYVGIATLITAVGAAIAGIITAFYSRSVHQQVSTNGDPRTLGEIASDVGLPTRPTQAEHDAT